MAIMSNCELLRLARARLGLEAAHIAAFLSINVPWYWDLEDYENEPLTLTVIQFLQLCVLTNLAPKFLLPPELVRKIEVTGKHPDKSESIVTLPIVEFLFNHCDNLDELANKVGWESSEFRKWLQDDLELGQMPLETLSELCQHLAIDITSVLDAYFAALGRSPQNAMPNCQVVL